MSTPQVSRIEAAEKESSTNGDYVLSAGTARPLLLSRELTAQLMDQVNEGIRAVPRGGAEVGGLLIGPKNANGAVKLEKLQQLQVEYCFGPSFRFSAKDLAALQETMSSAAKDSANTVVGFYRSWTRGEERLRESDQEILRAIEKAHPSYAADFRFLMIISPLSKLAFSAEVAVRRDSDWKDWQSCLLRMQTLFEEPGAKAEQTQELTRPAGGALTPASPAPAPSVLPAPAASLPKPRPAAPSDLLKSKQVPRQMWIYIGAGLVLVTGAFGLFRGLQTRQPRAPQVRTVAAPPAPVLHTGFSASPEGPMWKLSWNRDAVASLHPREAFLSIHDGGSEQRVALTNADLATGMLFYTPQSGNLLFGLTLMIDGAAPMQEEVRVLHGPTPAQPPAQAVVQIPTPDNHLRTLRPFTGVVRTESDVRSVTPDLPAAPALEAGSNRLPAAPIAGSAIPAPPEPPVKRPAPEPVTAKAVASPEPAVTRSAPEPVTPTAAVSPEPVKRSVPEPLTTKAAASSELPVTRPVPEPVKAATTAPPVPAPVPLSVQAPAGSSATTTANPLTSQTQGNTPANFVAAIATHQVRARRPAGASLTGSEKIQVKVTIDATGKVTKVTPQGRTATNFALMDAAALAARQWEFKPAQMNGRAIQSEMVLVFEFGGQ
ncbi:MAG: hypothetical protein JO323_21400 [Acidobacteriia bacterium]|nr:hypothetical protein [Terriglobia bacterium]